MSFSFLPKAMTHALTDLTPRWLQDNQIRLLMLDFDNTIVPYTRNEPEEAVLSWLQEIRESGVELCVVSNSKRPRVVDFCNRYGLACVTHARKPFSKGIRQCLHRFDRKPEESALVGDQIYTDVLGANAAGVYSILVDAIDNHNIWLKLRHVAEKPFIIAARKRRI